MGLERVDLSKENPIFPESKRGDEFGGNPQVSAIVAGTDGYFIWNNSQHLIKLFKTAPDVSLLCVSCVIENFCVRIKGATILGAKDENFQL